jgi:hypothetical protein
LMRMNSFSKKRRGCIRMMVMCIKKMAGVDGVEHGVDLGDRVVLLHSLTCTSGVDVSSMMLLSSRMLSSE